MSNKYNKKTKRRIYGKGKEGDEKERPKKASKPYNPKQPSNVTLRRSPTKFNNLDKMKEQPIRRVSSDPSVRTLPKVDQSKCQECDEDGMVEMEKMMKVMDVKGGMKRSSPSIMPRSREEILNDLRIADEAAMKNMMQRVREKRTELGIRNDKNEDETDTQFKEYESERFQEIWDEGMGSFVNPSEMRSSTDSAPSSGDFAREKGFPTKPFLTKDFFQKSMSLNVKDQEKIRDTIRTLTPEQSIKIADHLKTQIDDDKGGKKRRRTTRKKKKTKRKSRKYRKRVKPMDIPE